MWQVWLLVGVGLLVAASLLMPSPKMLEAARNHTTVRRVANRLTRRLRSRRPWILAYGLLFAAGLLVVIVWLLPVVLTRHPVIPEPADRHKAITDTRVGLITLLVALGATGSLAYTARSYRLNREGQITDRYTKAVAQLGDETLAVRLGGMYALERIAVDSERDQRTVVEVLSAFVRKTLPVKDVREVLIAAPDCQAAMTVLGRLPERPRVNRADLPGAHLEQINLQGAHLNGADLAAVHLQGANLKNAHLKGADLAGADLTGASFSGAHLNWAVLKGAQLRHADFYKASLKGTHLEGAGLAGTILSAADFTRSNLEGADLSHAEGLTQQQVDSATGDASSRLPSGLFNPWTEGSTSS